MSSELLESQPEPVSREEETAPQAGPSSVNKPTMPVELNKDGAVSKMRLHRGNVPSLPQTKLCPLCPAKFTRTTHLNRHLRTHTNERLHECDRCHSQFTRSDLLTRHKRSCGDSSNANRSRRKSCQACAESKVKCDLQQPCTKCRTRNRECVYVTPPNPIIPSASGSRPLPRRNSPEDIIASHSSSDSSPSPALPNKNASLSTSYPSLLTTSSISSQHSGDSILSPNPSEDSSVDIPGLATPLDVFSNPLDSLVDVQRYDHRPILDQSHLGDLTSNEMFDDLFSNVFTSNWQKMHNPAYTSPIPDFTNMSMDTGLPVEGNFTPENTFPFSPEAMEGRMTNPIFDTSALSSPLRRSPEAYDGGTTRSRSGTTSAAPLPSEAELQSYLSLFFSAYLPNMPIVHTATFTMEGKPQILVTAMQACGALYVRTRTAMNFINSALTSARDELVAEYAKQPTLCTHQVNLSLAVCLLQTIGLFHQMPDQRASSNVYHGMLVMMIRLSGLVSKHQHWQLPKLDMSDPEFADLAWREWAIHESAKRALLVSYLHDCCHCIYFNLRPTFLTSEFDLGLPVDEALWKASSAAEWMILLDTPSPYGSQSQRMYGLPLRATYKRLNEMSPSLSPPVIMNPFAHFIVIHAILRKLFEDFLEDRMPDPTSGKSASAPSDGPNHERIFQLQLMLHHWLQSWLSSPETPRLDQETEPRFVFNALPFYWFAQVSILAYQEGQPPFGPGATYVVSGEAKFRLMKKWEKHIRVFLRKNEQAPTLFWNELMTIRLQDVHSELQNAKGQPDAEENLLGFFPET